MNSLSWLIYLAEVCGSISTLFGFTSFLSVAAVALHTVIITASNDTNSYRSTPKDQYWKLKFAIIGFAFFIAIVVSLLPSKQTVYLIAGSEAGEMVVKSSEAQEILSDVKDILKGQLNSLKPK